MKEKGSDLQIQHLRHQGTLLTTNQEIENLAKAFEKNSSTTNCHPKFQAIWEKEEQKHFYSNNTEPYNQPFTMEELLCSIRKSHDTAVGPDQIHYQFLKHLPTHSFTHSLSHLLKIFNAIWKSGNIPNSWQEALIIPIPKPGKDHTDANNYRPIALTSCLCKTMERMVNNQLTWILESEGLLNNYHVASDEEAVRWITSSDSKLTSEMDSSERNMWLLSFLTWRKHTTQRGDTAS